MTQEEKQLLLKDLCGRVPYGVNFSLGDSEVFTIKGIDFIITDEGDREYAVTAYDIEPIEIAYVKPYLRPMETMTEKEKFILQSFFTDVCFDIDKFDEYIYIANPTQLDLLNAYHFDYRGLIPMSLALEAPEGMYKTESL